MPETVACPHCGAQNTAADGGSPFFCVGCKAIVDLRKAISRPGSSQQPGRPPDPSHQAGEPSNLGSKPSPLDATRPAGKGFAGTSSADAGSPTGYVSRYDSASPRDVAGPAGGPAVAGSIFVGLCLAAAAGLGLGAAAGFLNESIVRIPILYAFLVGWMIKRALALGSGGGTPDRGLVGGLVLLAIVVASFGVTRWVEYRSIASRQGARYEEAYGGSPARAVADPAGAIDRLHEKAVAGERSVTLSDGYVMVLADEKTRLDNAKATGRLPREGYDIDLLASSGRLGFAGHIAAATSHGQRLRLFGKNAAVNVPGAAMIAYWLVEFGVLLLCAFARVD